MRGFRLTLYICIFFAASLSAQTGPLVSERHEVISREHNKIHLPGDTSVYRMLYEKMDELFFEGKGKVNIVHMGGSHIQADMWSDRVRDRLQHIMPAVNGGRGFLFPYRMAKTNNPSGYEVEYTGEWKACRNVLKDTSCVLGLSGISVTTQDSISSLHITFRDAAREYSFTKLRVFYPEEGSYSIIFPSDSIIGQWRDTVRGFTEFILPYRQDTISLEFRKTDSLQTGFTLYGLSLETDEPGFVYHSIGVNGASVPSYNRCQLLARHISALEPDLIIFSIGINDAHSSDFSVQKYMSDYDTLISSIHSMSPGAAILFTTNSDSYLNRRTPNRNAFDVNKAMEEMSVKYNAGVWDIFGLMGGLGSIREWEYKGYAQRDRIHLNREGYQLLGDMLFNAIIKSYGDYLGNDKE